MKYHKIFIFYSIICTTVLCSCESAVLPNSLQNGSFDQQTNNLPTGWHLDGKVKQQGKVSLSTTISGAQNFVLKLTPNNKNNGASLLGLGQMLDARALRGKKLNISVSMAAVGTANAILGVHALGKDGDLGHIQIRQSNQAKLVRKTDSLKIPKKCKNLIVYVIVEGQSGYAVFDNIRLDINTETEKIEPLSKAIIKIDLTKKIRNIPETLFGTNVEWIFDGQGLWDAKNKSLNQEAVKLAKKLKLSLIRFPGGVFSDTYHWRDGIGTQDKRPRTKHYPKGPMSKHYLGSLEAVDFARRINANLLITVNAGTGTAREAADWVRYMNKQKYEQTQGVTYWEIGNELYMDGDLSGGHTTPNKYAQTFLKFAKAMKAVDPGIKVGAIGGLNYGNYRFIKDNR